MLFYWDTDTYSHSIHLLAKVRMGQGLGLLIKFVQDKPLGSQEETCYGLCWQQRLMVLFPLRARDQKGNEETQKYSGTPSPLWDSLGWLPPPYNPQNGAGPPPATATTTVAARGVGEVRGAEPTTQVQGHCCCWQNQNRRVRPQAQSC